MLKTLTLSAGLAFVLGAGSLALAGHHGVVASEQVAPCEQSVLASPQGETCAPAGPCGLAKMKHKLCDMFKPKPKVYTYTWVLKKKRVWGHKSCGTGTCGAATCDTCGVTASEQYPSSQSPAVYGTGQATYGSGQAYAAPATYGSGQAYAAPTTYSAPAAAPAAPSGDEAPPAPAMEKLDTPAPPAPSVPEVPEAPKVSSNNSLLFLAPSGN